MKRDQLFLIFRKHLEQTHNLKETANELILKVTRAYMYFLLTKGNIPFHLTEIMMKEIEAEVLEIYRKKTYGFLTLQDYRQKHYVKAPSH